MATLRRNAPLKPDDAIAISGHAGYSITPDGRVFSSIGLTLRELKQQRGGPGRRYRYVCLGKGYRSGVHQLLARAFLPVPAEFVGRQLVVRHKDNSPSNNRIENIEWGTQRENLRDRIRHGTVPYGESNAASKLTKEVVIDIRKRRDGGEGLRSIASRCGIAYQTVWKIATKRTWPHV